MGMSTSRAFFGMQPEQLGVLVPFVTVGTLDETNAALRKAPRQQTLPAEIVCLFPIEPVEFLGGRGFLVHLERLGRDGLHAECQLERLNAAPSSGSYSRDNACRRFTFCNMSSS